MAQPSTLHKRFWEAALISGILKPKAQVFAACSGGVDSMVLAHLLHRCQVLAGILHVNYKLRGEDSDLDEHLVRHWAETLGVPIEVYQLGEGELPKSGLQGAARSIRYQWFASVLQPSQALATGHHANDQLETVLMHYFRGAGLQGLQGMAASSVIEGCQVIRPLLPFSREGVLAYAQHNDIPWREDSSNDTNLYLRNKLRHGLAQEVAAISPSWVKVLTANTHLAQAEQFWAEQGIQKAMAEYFHSSQKADLIGILDFDQLQLPSSAIAMLLYRLAASHGQPSHLPVDEWEKWVLTAKNGDELTLGNISWVRTNTAWLLKRR